MVKKLSECKIGEKVKIDSLKISEHKEKRFLDMGLLPGTKIEVIRIAPLGDPIAIKVKGFQMSFRKQEADEIMVVSEIER